MSSSILLLVTEVHLQDRDYLSLWGNNGPSLLLDAVNLEFPLSYSVSRDIILVFETFFKIS